MATHNYVTNKLCLPGMYDSLLLFCAKALAINYFCIPSLAQTIVRAVVQSTPISGRRSRKYAGQDSYNNDERKRKNHNEADKPNFMEIRRSRP